MTNLLPEVIFDDEARANLLKGVEVLARAVSTTLGPKGRNVIIERDDGTYVLTKDGVTVAKSVNVRNPYQQMGVQMVREVAQRTNDVAGDGTTTATTLAYALFAGGMKLLTSGYSAVEIKRGIDYAVTAVIGALKSIAIPVDNDKMIINVGSISANGERAVGELLAQAMTTVGRNGVITVEEAKGLKTYLECVEGARFDRGYFSSYFITDADKMLCELNNPIVVISNLRFSAAAELIPLLEFANKRQQSLLIIADEVEGEALQLMVTNHMRGTLKSCAIKAPAFGEHRVNMLHDIAALLGGQLITAGDKMNSESSVKKLFDDGTFGKCRKVVIDKSRTTFIGSLGSDALVKKRVDTIKDALTNPVLTYEERGMLNERLAKLNGGIAIIRVGGSTELELIERKYRVEDALNATQAAVEEGIVPGGGVALVKCVAKIKEILDVSALTHAERLGVDLVFESCHAPLRKIVENASGDISIIVENDIKKDDRQSFGYDAAKGVYVDVLEAGIIDPVKVTRTALENAASVASLLLTVNSCVLNVTERTT